MTPSDWLLFPMHIQVALASGYVGYSLARRGLRERERTADVWLCVLAFGLVGLVGWDAAGRVGEALAWKAAAAVLASAASGALWRRWGRRRLTLALGAAGISRENELGQSWQRIIQDTSMAPTELRVTLKDGTVLKCYDVQSFGDAALSRGTFDNDGNVALYVTDVIASDGTEREANDVRDPVYGDLLTYVPREEILHVGIRLKKL